VTVRDINHSTLDYSGRGRGGIDRKFVAIGGVMQEVAAW
jgi:hypothetical protein